MGSKEKVLTLLEQSEGYVSGEKIAAMLNISRNSIWKAMNRLRKSGYEIEAVTNRGYRLVGKTDRLSKDTMERYLKPWVRTELIEVVDSLASTNDALKEAAIGGAPHGSVLIASHQSHGNGHHAQIFDSPEGGLYMSILLRPEIQGEIQPRKMAEEFAQIVSETITKLSGYTTEIRGVNDLFFNDRKVCGILTESVTDFESGEYQWIVVGIGVLVPLFPNPKPSRNMLAAEIINRILII